VPHYRLGVGVPGFLRCVPPASSTPDPHPETPLWREGEVLGYQDDVNAPQAWERHLNSRVEIRWPNCGELSAGEDLIEAHSGIGFYEEKKEWAWPITTAGGLRTVLGYWVMRYDPFTGLLFTSVEKLK